MVVGIGPGNDVTFDEQKIKAYSKFANKLWNVARFILGETNGADYAEYKNGTAEDVAAVQALHDFMKEITVEMEEYKFYIVSEKLYHYIWHTFADGLLEQAKQRILSGTDAESAKWMLHTHLTILLKALHPFMPFVTEELWSLLEPNAQLLCVTRWPYQA
jgi:valyl-tRNA synthetase